MTVLAARELMPPVVAELDGPRADQGKAARGSAQGPETELVDGDLLPRDLLELLSQRVVFLADPAVFLAERGERFFLRRGDLGWRLLLHFYAARALPPAGAGLSRITHPFAP